MDPPKMISVVALNNKNLFEKIYIELFGYKTK